MSTDNNLLFGILAMQADFIDRNQFVEACAAWASRKESPLADLLVERGWLNSGDREAVERLMRRKLAKHGGDVQASLAEVAGPDVQRSLAGVPDEALQRSLTGLPTLIRTVDYTPESRDRYTVTRLHAKGGIGQVWLARDHDLGRDVALKDLRPEKSENPRVAARFLEEAQVTGQLEHPNIVPVYELARRSEDQRLYYTMRFVHGKTLAVAIKAFHMRRCDGEAKPLEFRELVNAFNAVCHAVTYAHSRGVIHRDLKPQNVVLGDFGEVVLLDWGLAKLVGRPDSETEAASVVVEHSGVMEPTVEGQVLGTPAYMAPEQADGRQELIGPRTDVYGLGAMLYQVLTGNPPFLGSNTQEVLERVRRDDPEVPRRSWPEAPRAMAAICKRAMAKRQAERYPTAAELGRDVQRWLGNEPVSAYAEPFSERVGRWLRRYPALTSAALTLLAATVVALSAGLLALNESKKEIDAQRQKADSNFNDSLGIMQQSLGALEYQMERAPVAGMQPFQKQLLVQQIERFERFPPEYLEREQTQIALAAAYYRLGKVSQDVGTLPEAMRALIKARDFYEAAKAPEKSPALYQERIERCYFSIGQVCLALGDPAAAREALGKSVASTDERFKTHLKSMQRTREDAAGKIENPQPNAGGATGNLGTREQLAWGHTYLAIAERRTGRIEDALRSFASARELFTELIREENRSIDIYPYFPNGIGFCLLHQGQLEQELGRAAQATSTYQSALVHLRRAITLQQAKATPNNKALAQFHGVLALAQFHGVLALAVDHNATHLAEGNREAEAAAASDEAIALLKDLHRENPALLTGQARLAMAQANLGHMLLRTGKLDMAEANFRKALELAERLASGPAPTSGGEPPSDAIGNPEFMDGRGAAGWALCGLAIVHEKRGQQAEAMKTLRRAESIGAAVARHAPVHRYRLAGAQALASGLADDKQEKLRLADQALDSLRQAVELGYRNAAWIERDPALESLRLRAEFQQIQGSLKK